MVDKQNQADTTKVSKGQASSNNKRKAETMYQGFASASQSVWSLLAPIRHIFSNSFRYIVITCLFLYLLTAVVLFNDIMAFHDRVAADVGDDARARRAVLMLHEMEQNPERYPRASTDLPEGTLAVALGAIQASHKELEKFSDFVGVSTEAAESEQETTTNSGADLEMPDRKTERFNQHRASIQEQFADLDEYLTDHDLEVAIPKAIRTFRDHKGSCLAAHKEDEIPDEETLLCIEDGVTEFRKAVLEADDYIPAYRLSQSIKARLKRLDIRTIDQIDVADVMGRLDLEVDDFDAGLQTLMKAIETFQRTSRAGGIAQGAVDDASKSDKMVADAKAPDGLTMASMAQAGMFESPTDAFAEELAVFHDSVVKDDASVIPFGSLAAIHRRLLDLTPEEVEPIVFAGEMDALKSDIQSFRGKVNRFEDGNNISETLSGYIKIVDEAVDPPITQAKIQENLPRIREVRTGFDELTETLSFNRVTPKLFDALSMMDLKIELAMVAIKTPSPGKTFAEKLNFDRQLQGIQKALEDRYPGYFTSSMILVDNVAELRAQLAVLDKIEPKKHLDIQNANLDPEAAQKLFDEEMLAMGKKLTAVEEKLKKQGRVVALANVLEEDGNESPDSAKQKADGILQNYDALQRFGWIMMPLSTVVSPTSVWSGFGFNPLKLATLTTDSITLIYVFLVGAIGSLIYITKYQLKQVLEGHRLDTRPQRSLPWFLFRPFFGIVVALALYFMVRAGQMAFGSGDDGGVGTTLNIPILSVLALFAGILSWDALRTIETRGQSWFRSQAREDLWATGLGNALRAGHYTEGECAERIGRSPEQVERWLKFQDKVTVEMQDRIKTWTNMRQDELFGDTEPRERIDGKALWALGLRAALDSQETRLDARSLLLLLREDDNDENIQRIKDWIALKKQVPPATQWRLVDLLDTQHSRLFSEKLGDLPVWGMELRRVIEDRKQNAENVAHALNASSQRVHEWKELDEPVPQSMRKPLMTYLKSTFSQLFEPGDIRRHKDLFLPANDLRRALERKKMDEDTFASLVDVEPVRVKRWIKGETIAKPTRETILRILGKEGADLFKRAQITDQSVAGQDRPSSRRRKPAYAIGIARAMEQQGIEGARVLAERLHRTMPTPAQIRRVQGWIDQKTKVSPENQDRLMEIFDMPYHELFA